MGDYLKLSRCKQVEMCHDGDEERKCPYQAKDNGDMREKKDINIK